MNLYRIRDNEVALFPLKYVRSILNCTRSGITQKENRGVLPPANFRSETNNRLYSIEDLAVIEYIFKEVWPSRQGLKTPEWVQELTFEALAKSKRVVLQYGQSRNSDDWTDLHQKYNQFNKYRLQIYIETWRNRLLKKTDFFPELLDEGEEID